MLSLIFVLLLETLVVAFCAGGCIRIIGIPIPIPIPMGRNPVVNTSIC